MCVSGTQNKSNKNIRILWEYQGREQRIDLGSDLLHAFINLSMEDVWRLVNVRSKTLVGVGLNGVSPVTDHTRIPLL